MLRAAASLCLALACAAAQAADGAAQFRAGDYAGARATFEAQLSANPQDAQAEYYLGRIALNGEQATAALAHLRSAAQLAPGNAEYQRWLGEALVKYVDEVNVFRKPTVARQLRDAFARAVELDPDMLDAREALMEFYLRAPSFIGGGIDKAKLQAQEIARRDAARGHKAGGDLAAAEDRFDAATREYQLALQINPNYPQARAALAKLAERSPSKKRTHI